MHPELSTEVDFALKSTPANIIPLMKELGLSLSIHQSTLSSEDVFITKHRPNMSGHLSICAPGIHEGYSTGESLRELSISEPETATKTSFRVSLDPEESKIAHLTTHLDILPSKCQDLLRSGAAVSVQQLSPFRIAINLGSGSFRQQISLPIPLQMTGGKTRIARKSSYIEYIAPAASKNSLSVRPESVFPMVLREIPTLRNLHYVKLDQLPVLDLKSKSKIAWIITHVGSMFSVQERQE